MQANLTNILPAVVLAASVGGWLSGPTAMAQGGGAAGHGSQPWAPPEQHPADLFRAYALRHTPADKVRPQLLQLLSALPTKTDVVVDRPGNRLLVNGSAAAHGIVGQFLQSVDRGPQAPAMAAPAAPVAAGHRVPAHEQPRVLRELQARFPSQSGVRIAGDPHRHQVLVVAPPQVQEQIARFLQPVQAGPPPTAQPAAQPNMSFMQVGQTTGQIVRLTSTWESLHGKLETLWGNRLTAHHKAGSDPRLESVWFYTVRLKDGKSLRLEVDRRTNPVSLQGPAKTVADCARLLAVLDRPPQGAGVTSQVVQMGKARKQDIERAIAAARGLVRPASGGDGPTRPWSSPEAGSGEAQRRAELARMLFQPRGDGQPYQKPPKRKPGEKNGVDAPPGLRGALIGEVEVIIIPDLDLIILVGRPDDVDKIVALIQEIDRRTTESAPIIEVYELQHVNSEALGSVVNQLYSSVYSARSGSVSITPLVDPNALLLIGQEAALTAAKKLIAQLDKPAGPDTQFQVFRLRNMPAQDAQLLIQQFYGAETGPRPVQQQQQQQQQLQQLPGLFPRINVIADFRSNSLIVRGSRRDLNQIARLVNDLDSDKTASELALRIFPLRNSLAVELAQVLQAAINSNQAVPQVGAQQPGAAQLLQQPGAAQAGQQGAQPRSAALRLLTLDAEKKEILKSGILTDVLITPDARANALVVRAPENSMELIRELINQLDTIPGAAAQVKVINVVNGDASSLVEMLIALLGEADGAGPQQQQQFGPAVAAQPGVTGAAQGESVLVPLRFAVDTRTNSILASGSPGDLILVEAILDTLSQSDVKERQTRVFRLQNAPADLISQAIDTFLQNQRVVQNLSPRSAFEQLQEEVVVVGEIVTNSLIISATPRFFEEIEKIITDLDRRPPMVMIQVLLAEVALNNTDEFGVELGLQSSVLFDRSLLQDIMNITNTEQFTGAGGAVTTVTNQLVQSARLLPGFAFNNQDLGNSGSTDSLNTSDQLGTQGLSHFAVGRTNNDLGFGGLVLSASSNSVSMLVRALQECRRLDVLSRPMITTMNNQPGFVQVGQVVQLIQSSSQDPTTLITTNVLGAERNVGLILGVTPRISDDGHVAMEIDVEKSKVGPEDEGIPISILATGETIRSPRIDITTASTTVSALSGQTIVLGGLITRTKSITHRRVPLLASVPILGHLFRYDSETQQKTELLIILTPHVIWNEADAEILKQIESARMSWVLSDVHKLHNANGLRSRWDALDATDIPTIYPHADPAGEMIEQLPSPEDPRVPYPPKQPMPANPMRPDAGQPGMSPSTPSRPAPGQATPRRQGAVPARAHRPQPPVPPTSPGNAPIGPAILQPASGIPTRTSDLSFRGVQPAVYQPQAGWIPQSVPTPQASQPYRYSPIPGGNPPPAIHGPQAPVYR